MEKYKTIRIPVMEAWWCPDNAAKLIQWIEEHNPGYAFVQFVTNLVNSGYPDFEK